MCKVFFFLLSIGFRQSEKVLFSIINKIRSNLINNYTEAKFMISLLLSPKNLFIYPHYKKQFEMLGNSSYSFISTQKVDILNNKHFIEPGSFIVNILLDIALIVVAFIIWRFLWVGINILQIKDIYPSDRNQGFSSVRFNNNQSIWQAFKCLRKILANLSNMKSYIEIQCGFQAFTYMFFLRRLSHIMIILTITDICVWIPYQLYFQPFSQFSLITMPSQGNDAFRTFYTLWVACVVLYGMEDMRAYLRMRLKFNTLRNQKQQVRLLNSLKSKTLHIHFLTQNVGDSQLKIRAKLLQELNIEARIIAMLRIPNYSEQLELQYKIQIHKIVKDMGIQNLSSFWRLLKAKKNQQAQNQLNLIQDDMRKSLREGTFQHIKRQSKSINSYFVVLEDIKTADYLCDQFDTQKALFSVIPYFGYGDVESDYQTQNRKMIIKWAQQPKDIMWINMTPHKVKFVKFVLFNFICVLLLFLGFILITISSNQSITQILFIPRIFVPTVIIGFNSLIRFLISKATQWQNKLFQYEVQMKQFKVISIYYIINVIIGSIVRDTLNLMDVLQTGWGWIQLLSLVYQKIDGYFYYLFIFNQTAISFFVYLIKPGEIFLDCFQSKLSYKKLIQIKHQSKYAQNDTFRYGYSYASDFIVLAVILLYSVSIPLIHFFGFTYFYSRFYLNGYTLAVFHRYQQCCSNMRMIQKVISMISIMVVIWIFLTATLMVFQNTYSNVLILYISMGAIIYFGFTKRRNNPLDDPITDEQLTNTDLTKVIQEWKRIYLHPIDPKKWVIQSMRKSH